jgi:methyl-accepting chemotaxis protein
VSAHTPADTLAEGAGEPGPRQRRTLRRSLTVRFILIALVSVLLLGGLNYWQARSMLNDAVTSELTNQQATVARSIRDGLARVEQGVAVIAGDLDTVRALTDFSVAFDELEAAGELLSEAERDELNSFYESTLLAAIADAGFDPPPVAEVVPASPTGRYLQYHYIVQNPSPPDERDQMTVSQTDDTEYARVHGDQHESMVRLAELVRLGAVMLVDDQGRVVYTTSKQVDFGTSALDGPYRESGLARAVNERLPAAAIGETILVDFERYLPAGARPTMFAAAAVRSDATTIGAVVVEVPIEALNALTTANMSWEDIGLGRTGEVYVVGSDRRMRSDSRLWLESPDSYLQRIRDLDYPPELADAVDLFETTTLLQPVETEAVDEAFGGEAFVGRSADYLDRSTLTVAGPVASNQLDWVVVGAVTVDEASEALDTFTRQILVVAAIAIPLVAGLATILATRMTRPIDPLVAAAQRISSGDLDTLVPDMGANEYGDVGRRLNTLTSDLHDKESALAEEEREITNLLLSALPPRVVDQVRLGERQITDLVDTATIIAMTVGGLLDNVSIDAESALELSARLSGLLEEVADQLAIERVRSSSTQHVFAAGLDSPDPQALTAAEFAVRAADAVDAFSEEIGVAVTFEIGMCGGEVIAGVLEADQLTYGVFGDAARTALALSSIAGRGKILVCAGTASDIQQAWSVTPVDGLLDLRGEPVAAHVLERPESTVESP